MEMELNLQPENLLLPLKAAETLETVLQKAAELLALAEAAGQAELAEAIRRRLRGYAENLPATP